MLPNAKTQFGMNFAYGGTGVFDTYVPLPNMTVQINLFEDVISREKVYMGTDLQSSIALVSLAGNDYATLRMREPPNPEVSGSAASFSPVLVKLLSQSPCYTRQTVECIPEKSCLKSDLSMVDLCSLQLDVN